MSDSYHPQPWLSPSPGGIQRPMGVRTNINLPHDANQADTAALTQIAHGIVQANAQNISRFVANNRQQHALNQQPYAEKVIRHDGLDARWRINHGHEKLELEVYPLGRRGASTNTSDTNLDGYLVWVHVDPYWPNPQPNNTSGSPTPYIVAMNGYILETAFAITGKCIGYPVLIGKTALLCSSYVGDVENNNPIVNDPKFKQPIPVAPPTGWGSYKAGAAPDGIAQSAIQKTFGYWLFDWENPHNPFQYLQYFNTWHNWRGFWNAQLSVAVGDPVFSKGIYFASSQKDKSPFNPRGKNSFGVTAACQFAEEVPIFNMFYGEFYDRGKYRGAAQSWHIGRSPGRTIAIPDSPLLFATAGYVYDYSGNDGGGIDFDLTPSVTAKGSAGDDNIIDIHGGVVVGGGAGGAGLNADQLASVDDWIAKVIQVNQQNDTQDSALINQRLDAFNAKWATPQNKTLLNEAYNVQASLSAMSDANGNYAPVTYGADGPVTVVYGTSTFYGPTQKYWFEWDNQFTGLLMPTYPLHYGLYLPGAGGANFYTNNPPTLAKGQTLANGGQAMTYQEFYTWATNYVKTDAVQQQQTEYDQIYANLPQPVYPAFPTLPGGDISKFTYSRITISGNSWSYTQ